MLWMKWFRLFSTQSPSISVFKKNILKFTRLGPSNIFNIYYQHGLKLLTRLHLDFCHLRCHKFTHNFSDRLDEICMCGNDTESTKYFLLQCSLFPKERQVLMNEICDIDSSPIDQNENSLSVLLFFFVKRTWITVKTPIFLMQTLAQVFSYELCEIFKNIFFYRLTPVAASDYD